MQNEKKVTCLRRNFMFSKDNILVVGKHIPILRCQLFRFNQVQQSNAIDTHHRRQDLLHPCCCVHVLVRPEQDVDGPDVRTGAQQLLDELLSNESRRSGDEDAPSGVELSKRRRRRHRRCQLSVRELRISGA